MLTKIKTYIFTFLNEQFNFNRIILIIPSFILVLSIVGTGLQTYKYVTLFKDEKIVLFSWENIILNDYVIILAISYLVLQIVYIIVKHRKIYTEKNSYLIMWMSSFTLICISLFLRLSINEYYSLIDNLLVKSKVIDWNFVIVEIQKNWSPAEMETILKSNPRAYAALTTQQIHELIFTYKDPQSMQAQMNFYVQMNNNNALAEKIKLMNQKKELEAYERSWTYLYFKYAPYIPTILLFFNTIIYYAKIDNITEEVVAKEAILTKKVSNINKDCKKSFEEMNERFAGVDKSFANVDKNFASINKSFTNVNKSFVNAEHQFANINKRIEQLQHILSTMQEKTT